MGDAVVAQEIVADLYRQTFAARLDAYVEWHQDPPAHWTSVRSELTVPRVIAGLTGPRPVSTYMETAAGLTHLGAIDFDRDDGWDMGLATAAVLTDHGATPYLERSRRGCHLWVVLDNVIFGDTVRLGLRWFVQQVDPRAGNDPKVELLPKKIEQRGPQTVGAPLRMPMMAHQTTGARYPLCDGKGQPIGTTISQIILAIDTTPTEVLVDAAGRVKMPLSEIRFPDWARRPAQEGGDVVQVLVGAGVANAVPGRSVKCPLHDDQQASLAISRDGERAWCKSPACEANNNGRGLGANQFAKALAPVA